MNRKSGNGKKILLIILILDVLVVSGIILYVDRPRTYDIDGPTINHSQNKDHIVANSTDTLTTSINISTTNFTTTSSTQVQKSPMLEEKEIRDTLTAYFDTLNRHLTEDAVNFFADEVEILINGGKDYSYSGSKEGIMPYLTMAFDLDPNSKISEITISNIIINSDKATVQMNYMISSESYGFSMSITEYAELVKHNKEWKIKKTNITY